MQYVTLGKSGLRASRVGFGGIPIQRIDAKECTALFDAVVAAGITTSTRLAAIPSASS